MLQYLVILLDRNAVSYCHYNQIDTKPEPIPLTTLQAAIRYAMTENLNVQFVYPNYELPPEYTEIINSIDHTDIRPIGDTAAEVLVANKWEDLFTRPLIATATYVIRTKKTDFFRQYRRLKEVLPNVSRLNVVLTDVETLTDTDITTYQTVLEDLVDELEKIYTAGHSPQFNLITDRMMLSHMNNCNAGWHSLTLAPDGHFYICPAFYQNGETESLGSLSEGPTIKNAQLYRIDNAPLCRHCDAWQCRRCIWLNRKTTLEVNTPGHEQCVAAHIERNAARRLLLAIRKHGQFLPGQQIKKIKYLDPFEEKDQW